MAAILGSVGAIIFFRLGQEDATKIAPVLQPYFSSLDTIGLLNWNGFARIQMKNEASPPFCFRTIEEGTPQDASVRPLLANIYLHYVLDLWIHQWRHRHAHGDMIIVRYADDVVFGFQNRVEGVRFLEELRERLLKFNLELNEAKTRLIEFGRYVAGNRHKRGEGKPDSFNFLGFTHLCGQKRNGKFVVLRHTMRKCLLRKCKELKKELRRRMQSPIPIMGRWLKSVLRGHYYGMPRNGRAMNAFHYHLGHLWFKTLRRRSQKFRVNWEQMARIIERYLPYPKIRHPYPEKRVRVITQGRIPVR